MYYKIKKARLQLMSVPYKIYTSRLKTSKGELPKTVRILLNPIRITNTVMPGKNTKNGISDGTKGSLNTKSAKHKLLTNANIMPTKLPSNPKKTYSNAEICKI